MKKITLFTLLLFSTTLLLAQSISPERQKKASDVEVEKVEQQVAEMIRQHQAPDAKLFYLYILAARNMRRHHFHDLAVRYYNKGLALNVEFNQNRLQAMLELAWTLLNLQRHEELKKVTLDLRQFARQHQFDQSMQSLKLTFDYFDVQSSPEKTVSEILGKTPMHFSQTNYFNFIVARELQLLMKRGDFTQAYDLFVNGGINSRSYYHHLLAYDLLAKINHSESPLNCLERAKSQSGLEADLCHWMAKPVHANAEKLIERLKKRPELEFLRPAILAYSKL
jgi:hypothetical protein